MTVQSTQEDLRRRYASEFDVPDGGRYANDWAGRIDPVLNRLAKLEAENAELRFTLDAVNGDIAIVTDKPPRLAALDAEAEPLTPIRLRGDDTITGSSVGYEEDESPASAVPEDET